MNRRRGKIDMSAWRLRAVQLAESLAGRFILKGVTEALGRAFDDDGAYLTLPAIWGPDDDGYDGPPVTDPLTVYFVMEGMGRDDSDVLWATSLTEILEDDIRDCGQDGSYADGLSRISAGLRALADRIDATLPAADPPTD